MIDLQIDNPKPMPLGFVVKSGLKSFSATFASKPGPVSATLLTTKLV